MPYKVTFGKKKKSQYKRPNTFKKKQSTKVMINRMPRRMHNVVAPIFFSTMQCQAQARIEIDQSSGAHFDVHANKMNNPFYGATLLSAIATGLGSVGLDDLQPAGFIALSNIYTSYRIHKCTMRVTMTPSNATDILLLAVLPQGSDQAQITTFQQAMSSPYSKTITCTGNNNIKQNTVTLGIKTRDFFGKTKQAFRAENDYAVTEAFTSAPQFPLQYDVWYQLYSGANNTGTIAVNVVLTYSVEFFAPQTNLPIDT